MKKHKIGALPVVQGEHIVAIVTEAEFVGLAARLLEGLVVNPTELPASAPSAAERG